MSILDSMPIGEECRTISSDTSFSGKYNIIFNDKSTTVQIRGKYELSNDDITIEDFNSIYRALDREVLSSLCTRGAFKALALGLVGIFPAFIYMGIHHQKMIQNTYDQKTLRKFASRVNLDYYSSLFLSLVIRKIELTLNLKIDEVTSRDVLISSYLVAKESGVIVEKEEYDLIAFMA